MKKGGKSKRSRRNIVLLALLAALCVGAAELMFCRYFEPELYGRIVAPARHAVSVVVDAGRAGLGAAGRFFQGVGKGIANAAVWTGDHAAALWEDLTAPKTTPEPPESAEPTEPPAVSGVGEPVYNNTVFPAPVSVTAMLEVDGRQILTGGVVDVTYFCQTDERWANLPFGADTIGPYGCGPTVMAITVASLAGTDIDPAAMAAWAAEHGYWASGAGSYLSIVLGTAQSFGLMAEPFDARDANGVLDALSQGKMLIALMGPGHFTTGGHFILLRGVTQAGNVLIADPNSPENSLGAWSPQLILDELSSTRGSGSPLWAVWAPDR